MVTMKEVAKKAGVSLSTVSRVINNNPSVDIQIRDKVLSWIKKMNYIPSSAAQTLARKKSNLIGLLVSDITNPYFVEILRTVEREATLHNYNIIFRDSCESAFTEKKAVEEFLMRNVDGILMVPRSDGAEHLNMLKERGVPIVCLTDSLEDTSGVTISHNRGGELAARHLLEQGYENFLYIGPEKDEKLQGFKECLESKGVRMKRSDMIPVSHKEVLTSSQVQNRLKEYIDSGSMKKSTGIFTSNDLVGIQALETLKEYGFYIPSDIGVVGFDNTYLSKLSNFQLTSVAQPIKEMGRSAFEILLCKINGEIKLSEKIYKNFESKIVVRNSSEKINFTKKEN